jgi:hypothetical protein
MGKHCLHVRHRGAYIINNNKMFPSQVDSDNVMEEITKLNNFVGAYVRFCDFDPQLSAGRGIELGGKLAHWEQAVCLREADLLEYDPVAATGVVSVRYTEHNPGAAVSRTYAPPPQYWKVSEWSGREAAGGIPESAREPSPVYSAGRVDPNPLTRTSPPGRESSW